MTGYDPDRNQEPHWQPMDQRQLTVTVERPTALGYPEHRWIYLWHWPIRAMHWAAAISIVVLFLTGFYIGRPYFMSTSAQSSFTLQWVRLAHFLAAGVLIATAIVRVYWLLMGNRFERLPALFPVRPRDWRNLVKMIKYYVFIHPERSPRYLGHNPLQQIFYTVTYAFAALMAVTGFIMIGQANPGGLIMQTFGRLTPLLGGLQMVRVIHHVATWYFPMFIVFHVYLSIRADLLDRSGTMSSMVSGGRFVPVEEHYADG
ncbi:MAG TPA: Ni/Fe-hydrogenase, b-type cytochrome subunit [Gemmatimonadaceae bacterium]|nr:Ni/Fe-hydrogenase, b-type cytochrome subunit [Gemmatimonadaceae bacterium]